MQFTEKFIEVEAPVERVFDYFSDFENFPHWMPHIKEVRHTGRHYTRWTAAAPLGTSVEWEAETTVFEPDHKIAWRSVRGDVDTEGEVIFEETRRGTTLMRVVLGYDPPAGRFGSAVARLFGTNPEEQLEEDLERFADVVEGRGRRAGRNGYDEGYRRDHDRERVERRARDRFDDDGRSARTHTRADSYRARDYIRDDRRRERPDEEPEGRRRFYEELQRARRRREEGLKQYREQRARDDEERRYRIEREARRLRDDERRQLRREEDPPRYRDEDERERPHHALTPRESARAPRQPDDDYSEKAFRRGVDKLMDDAPSTRWNRWK